MMSRFTNLIFAGLIFAFAGFANAAPITFNVDGVITKPDGTALEEASVQFQIDIRSPLTNGDCLLYREQFSVSMAGSGGYFSIPMGKGANLATPAYPLDQVLGSEQTLTGLAGCSSGSSYIPAASDDRQVTITFTDSSGIHNFTNQDIKAVPFAVRAKTAESVSGFTSSSLIKVDPAVSQTTNANSALSQAQYDEFWRLVKNPVSGVQTSAAITQANVESVFSRYGILNTLLNGTYAGNAATATALAATPGACPAGQYMSAMTASGAITCGLPVGAGGTVTSVTSANSYLSVATGTTTPVLTVNVGTAANTLAAGNDARFTDSRAPSGTASGDLSGTYPNPTVAKVSGKTVQLTSPAAGEVLTYDGTKFVNSPTAADGTKLPLAGGLMSGAIDMGSQNLINTGFVTMSANKSLHLSNNASDPAGLTAADKGKLWYNSTSGAVKFWDGSAAQPLGVAGSGLTSFNSQTGSTQTLATGSTGLLPNWSSGSNIHTLNIPMASSASVSAGLLSKTDYDLFTAKLSPTLADGKIFVGNASNTATAVSLSGDATLSNAGVLTLATVPLTKGGTGVTSFTGDRVVTTSAAGALQTTSCSLGQVISFNGAGAITCATPAAGSVTSVTSANSYLSVSTGTTTPVLTVNVGTAANTLAAGNDARFTDSRAPSGTAGGDLSGTYPNPSVAKISGKTVVLTTPAAGEFLKYDGANFVNASAADSTKLPLAGGTMTGAINMGSQDLSSTGSITMATNKNLLLSNNASDPAGLTAADKGKLWYNSTSGAVKFWDGSAAQPLGVAGSGLSSLNSQTGSTQTLATGSTGLLPNWSSGSNIHTLNIPMASNAGVTAGLLNKTDYDLFTAKLDAASSFSGDVSGVYSATSVDKIKGKTISPVAYSLGQTLRYDGTNWVNALLNFSDLANRPSSLAGYGITDAQSSTLANGQILVGNVSNTATAVSLSGDATLSNAGVLTLATVPLTKGGTGVTSFTGDRVVTTSAAGALQTTSCSLGQVISFNGAGAITCATPAAGSVTSVTSANSYLSVSAGTTTPVLTVNVGTAANTLAAGNDARFTDSRAPSGTAGGDLSGTYPNPSVAKISGKSVVLTTPAAGEFLKYDGVNFVNSAPAGLQTLNSQTGSTQSLAIGSTGLLPNWASGSNIHTLNIPMASSTSVSAGLLSKTDYDTFTAKLDSSSSFGGDVSGSSSALTVTKIKNKAVVPVAYAAGQTLRYDGTNWVNSTLAFADLSAKPTSIAGYGITDAVSNTLASGKILVGNGSNIATAVSMSGDATLSNAGALTLGTVPITKGGTGLTSFTADKVVTTSSGGALQTTSCALNEVITFTAGGAITCANMSSLVTGFVNGGNSLSAAAVLGTNDSFPLRFETAGIARVTVDTTGNVGIGTSSPAQILHLSSNTNSNLLVDTYSASNNSQISFRRANGSVASPTAVANNDFLGAMTVDGYDGTGFVGANQGLVGFRAGQSWSTGSHGTYFVVNTVANGTTTSTERLRVDPSGNVGIGTTSPSMQLDVRAAGTGGAAYFESTSSTVTPTASFTNNDSSGVAAAFTNAGGGNAASFNGGVTVNGGLLMTSLRQTASTAVSSSTAYAIPDLTKNVVRINLTGNATISLPSVTGLSSNSTFKLIVRVQQDATGGRTLAWSPTGGSIVWEGAGGVSGGTPVAPNLAANSITIYQFIVIGGETTWYGSNLWK